MNRFGDYKNFDACLNTTVGLDLVTDIIEQMAKDKFGGAEDESGSRTGK